MADTLTTQTKLQLSWLFQDALDLANVTDQGLLEYNKSTADGTGASQAEKIWHDTRTVAGGANDDLDLTALTQSVFGSTVTITLSKVRLLLIINLSTTSGDQLKVGAGSNPLAACWGTAGDQAMVGPDSMLLLQNKVDGWAVANGSTDGLRINNPGGNSIQYKIVIVGNA